MIITTILRPRSFFVFVQNLRGFAPLLRLTQNALPQTFTWQALSWTSRFCLNVIMFSARPSLTTFFFFVLTRGHFLTAFRERGVEKGWHRGRGREKRRLVAFFLHIH